MRPDLKDLEKKATKLRKQINLSSLTIAPLEADFNEAIRHWQENGKSQFWSRTAVRCLCAVIEARLFTFRQMAQELAIVSGVQFEKREIEILTEQRTATGVNGVQVMRPRFLPFPDSVRESFRLFAKSIGTTVSIDYGTAGFSTLCGTFAVRNRLMHPKQPFDVQVDIKDIDVADRGIAWFNHTYEYVVERCQAHIAQTIGAIMESKRH